MKVKRHLTINIEGVLKWRDSDLEKLFLFEDGSCVTAVDIREALQQKITAGYRVIPYNQIECEGFDKVTGCPGHHAVIAAPKI